MRIAPLLVGLLTLSNILSAQSDTLLLQDLEKKSRASYGNSLDSSMYYARQIIEVCKAEDVPEYHAFAINWIGICFMRKGVADSAEVYYQNAIKYGLANDVLHIAQKARLNRSINYFQQGMFDDAATAAMVSLEGFKEVGDSVGMAHAQYNLGNCLFRLGRYDESMTFYRDAEPVYKGLTNPWSLANLYTALGSVHQETDELDSALFYFNLSVKLKGSIGGENFCASEYINIADVYFFRNELDSAFLYNKKALIVAQAIGDQRKEATSYINLSQLFTLKSISDSGIYYAKKALEIYQIVNDDFIRYNAYLRLSEAYDLLGSSHEAYRYYKDYVVLKDSIENIAIEERVAELEKKYRLAEKDQELLANQIALKEKENAQQKQILIIVILILIIAGIVWWFSSRKKQEKIKSNLLMNRERTRIAMDLHDHVGAELTVVSSKLDTRIFNTKRENEKEELNVISDQVRQVNAILRETVWSIQNESITSGDLLEKIKGFAGKIFMDNGVSFESNCNNPIYELTPQQALTVYRICQEGITNCFKYAEASTLNLDIIIKDKSFTLSLADDGKGFLLNKVSGGYGIKNMKSRATQLKGTFAINSELQMGTAINVTIPIGKESTFVN
ncbi:MAG: hypothetical protein DRI54_02175 [Bacteroidetes bacterium]|nr:MAG: hypothetical protein DRI54_02175 [Bacteroidota bacterium]